MPNSPSYVNKRFALATEITVWLQEHPLNQTHGNVNVMMIHCSSGRVVEGEQRTLRLCRLIFTMVIEFAEAGNAPHQAPGRSTCAWDSDMPDTLIESTVCGQRVWAGSDSVAEGVLRNVGMKRLRKVRVLL